MQFAITMSVIGGLQILTNPLLWWEEWAPAAANVTMYLYQTGFEWGILVCKISLSVFVLILIFTIISRRVCSDEGLVKR